MLFIFSCSNEEPRSLEADLKGLTI